LDYAFSVLIGENNTEAREEQQRSFLTAWDLLSPHRLICKIELAEGRLVVAAAMRG
jgi:hypothetical protein